VGDQSSLWYYANNNTEDPRNLPPGVYGLSNANLDTPWPKVTLGKTKLQALLEAGAISHQALAATVSDQRLADQHSLREQGLDGTMEPLLSSQFIVTDTYGTRSSTTLWIDSQARASWLEQSFNEQGVLCGVQHKEIRLNSR
jgi:uncharacterized protein with NRDE domain